MAKSAVFLIALIFAVVGSSLADEVDDRKLLASTTTTTSVILATSVQTITVASTCYSTSNVTGICRRRRHGIEQPVILALDEDLDLANVLQPSETVKIEPTAEARLARNVQVPAIESSSSSNSDGVTEVEVRGLEQFCANLGVQGRAPFKFFGVTFVYTTTITATTISTITTTSGSKVFVINQCIPASLPFSQC